MPKYSIKTFGCQMNHSDSERMASFLQKNGLKPLFKKEKNLLAKDLAKADLVIYNTCGVRQMAEDRVYGQVHNLKKLNPKIKIVVTGCISNRKDVQSRLKNKVDLFTEIKDFHQKMKPLIKSDKILPEDYFNIKPLYENPFQANVPIMTGCNNFCSYCVVPYARGKEHSRPAKDILKEVKTLVNKGYKHIILLGQNVNSYHGSWIMEDRTRGGMKHETKINFSELLKEVNKIKGNFWISFVSNHPKDVTDEMVETVAKCKKVCENFHLPIQSGNDEILRNMNRKYTAKDYMKIIRKIKTAFKKHKPASFFSITCDIIVGFPGETREKFLDSAEIIRKAKYDMVFFGQFSPRPGTAAWKMKDNVSKKEKERREKYLNEILKKTTFANNKKYKGAVLEVLTEKYKDGFYYGKTRTLKNVRFTSKKKKLIGNFTKVKITKVNTWNLEGEVK